MLPIYFDPIWFECRDEPHQHLIRMQSCLENYTSEHETLANAVFRQARYDTWMRCDVMPFLLGLVPADWRDADFARCLGVDRAQPRRYREEDQIASPDVMSQWLRLFGKQPKDLPDIRETPADLAFAVVTAANRIAWEVDKPPKRKKPRADDSLLRESLEHKQTPLIKTTPKDAVLLYPLVNPSVTHEKWLQLGLRFSDDMLQITNDKDGQQFIVRLLVEGIEMLDIDDTRPEFRQARDDLIKLKPDCKQDACQLLKQIKPQWERLQIIAAKVNDHLKPLLFDSPFDMSDDIEAA